MPRIVVVSLATLVTVAALALPTPSGKVHAQPAAANAADAGSAHASTDAESGHVLVAAFAGGVACAAVLSWLVPALRRRRAAASSDGTAHADHARSHGAFHHPGGEWQMLDGETSDIVSLHDADGFVRYVSSPLLELTGFSRHELVGRHGHEFVHADDLPTLLSAVHSARSEAQTPPALIRLRDSRGRFVWIEAQFRHSVSRTGEPETLCVARSVARSFLPQVADPLTGPAAAQRSAQTSLGLARMTTPKRSARVVSRVSAGRFASIPLPGFGLGHRRASTQLSPERLDAWQGPSLQDLCHAFERREFELHYQLKVGLSNWEVTGAEALLRWNAPEGSGRTAEIIASAERSGFIVTLGEWVVRAAAHQSLQWRRAGLRFPVAVNVSAVQLNDGGFATLMRELVARDRELPAWLELEVTEQALAGDSDRAVQTIAQLVALGFTLHIDDFGVGYSKLAQLSRMPVRALKIDRSIVHDLAGTSGSIETVEAVVSLSRALHLKVIAEGVETAEQLELLRARGCDEVQGYLFSQPMAADAMRALVLPTPKGTTAGVARHLTVPAVDAFGAPEEALAESRILLPTR